MRGLSQHIDKWNDMYHSEKLCIENSLGDNVIEIHHIGSTSIDDLISKPQIDIVVSVHDLNRAIKQLVLADYTYKGEFNIPFRYFFGKSQEDLRINLHVVRDKDPEMYGFLLFRDYMKTHPDSVQEYSKLKLSIVNKLPSGACDKKYNGLNDYTLAKDEFIRGILKKAGFKGLCMRFVAHYNERTYESEICKKFGYIIKSDDIRFVFYMGPDIIGYSAVSVKNIVNIFFVSDSKYEKYFKDRLYEYIESLSR